MRLADQIIQSPSFEGMVASRIAPRENVINNDELLDQWMLENVQTMHHISGTCKMGPRSDEQAVVNQYGKVYGIDNLRVADASIMPDCVRANINVTVMTIAERVADFIVQGN